MKRPKSTPILDLSDFPIGFVRHGIMKANGVDIDEMQQKPMIAVVNSHTDINPGHRHLGELGVRVKEGIHAAGGIPFECNVPAPCDVFTEGNEGMRYVLPQRELIADMVETHMRSMLFDGIVMIASCDKIIPGMMIAAARLDLPTIFLTGGPSAAAIRFTPFMRDSIDHKNYDDPIHKLGTLSFATCGSCEVMGTANTFQCLSEVLGLSLPGSANVPGFHADKHVFARKTGMRIVQMVEEELNVGKILTKESLLNALIMDLAIGGSTNTTLHLPALAHALGMEMPLSTFNDYNRKIPTLCAISPNGPYGIIDLFKAGGIGAVMKVMRDDLNLECITVSGKTIGQIVDETLIHDETIIPPRDKPFRKEGSTAILYGNLAPDGAVIKQSALLPEMATFTGKARVFESEQEALAAFREATIKEGSVLVVRNEGPKGGPGMPETLAVTTAIDTYGIKNVALITDGRFSGASYGPCVGHVSPEAFVGGPIAALRDGDEISIDVPARTIAVKLTGAEIASRLEGYTPQRRNLPRGFIRRYQRLVSSAAKGAILDD